MNAPLANDCEAFKGRAWLRQLALLCGDHGFFEVYSRRGPSELALYLCDAHGTRIWLRTTGRGGQWFAHVEGTRWQTGGAIRLNTEGLRKAYVRLYKRLIKAT